MQTAILSIGTGLGVTALGAAMGYGRLQGKVKELTCREKELGEKIDVAQKEINESKVATAEIMIKLQHIELELQQFRTENNEVTRELIKAIENISESKQ